MGMFDFDEDSVPLIQSPGGISVMRGVALHVHYIYFGQCTNPMGSGRPS